VLGDTRTGKTTLLRHVIRTIRDNSTPERVAFTVLDRRLHLVDEPLFPPTTSTPPTSTGDPGRCSGCRPFIEKSRPRPVLPLAADRLVIRGPHPLLIIDDVDQIPTVRQ